MDALTLKEKGSIRRLALDSGADFAAWIDPADIPILPELQDICRQNSCGQFGTSWMGPPAIGTVEELSPKVRSNEAGSVVQTVSQLEDSFDYPGMIEAKARFQVIFTEAVEKVRRALPEWTILALSAGCCRICGKCIYPDQPCLRPGEAMASVESYGIYVNAMLNACGLKYNNGPDTIYYAGLILFARQQDPPNFRLVRTGC